MSEQLLNKEELQKALQYDIKSAAESLAQESWKEERSKVIAKIAELLSIDPLVLEKRIDSHNKKGRPRKRVKWDPYQMIKSDGVDDGVKGRNGVDAVDAVDAVNAVNAVKAVDAVKAVNAVDAVDAVE